MREVVFRAVAVLLRSADSSLMLRTIACENIMEKPLINTLVQAFLKSNHFKRYLMLNLSLLKKLGAKSIHKNLKISDI